MGALTKVLVNVVLNNVTDYENINLSVNELEELYVNCEKLTDTNDIEMEINQALTRNGFEVDNFRWFAPMRKPRYDGENIKNILTPKELQYAKDELVMDDIFEDMILFTSAKKAIEWVTDLTYENLLDMVKDLDSELLGKYDIYEALIRSNDNNWLVVANDRYLVSN